MPKPCGNDCSGGGERSQADRHDDEDCSEIPFAEFADSVASHVLPPTETIDNRLLEEHPAIEESECDRDLNYKGRITVPVGQ